MGVARHDDGVQLLWRAPRCGAASRMPEHQERPRRRASLLKAASSRPPGSWPVRVPDPDGRRLDVPSLSARGQCTGLNEGEKREACRINSLRSLCSFVPSCPHALMPSCPRALVPSCPHALGSANELAQRGRRELGVGRHGFQGHCLLAVLGQPLRVVAAGLQIMEDIGRR